MNHINVNGQKSRMFIFFAIVIFIMIGSLDDAAGKEDSFWDNFKRVNKKTFNMSPTELRIRMQELSVLCAGIIEKSGDEIIALTNDPVVKRKALLWKMNSIPAVYKAFYNPKPLIAMLDSWAFSLQMKQFFKSEAGQKAFGKWHIYRWDAAVLIEAKMVELAKVMSPTGDISLPENFIRSWSDDHPIQIPFFVRESMVPILSSGTGEKALSAFQAAAKMPYQLDDITNRFTVYGDYLPKQARWQAELLLSDLGVNEKIETLIAELTTATQVLQKVGEVVEKSPDFITDERSAVLEVFRNERLETLSAVNKQRIETLDTIDQQRIETLDFLTREKTAIIDALENERKIVLEVLESERHSVLNEVESMGNRIVQDAIKELDKLIDHFFLRAAQLVGICLIISFCFGGVGIYMIGRKRQVPQM